MMSRSHPQVAGRDVDLGLDAENIPDESWEDAMQNYCPGSCLCHRTADTTVAGRIARQIRSVCTDADLDATHAVYTLECRPRPRRVATRLARSECRSTNPRYVIDATDASVDRLLYVGRARDLPRRLQQHMSGESDGANFTQVFPPVRLLDVDWFELQEVVGEAEQEKAAIVDEEFPDAFVYQA